MIKKKKRESRKDQKEDIKKIILIGQRIDYSDRDKVRSFCGWLLKNPEFFSSAVGKRYVRELRKSALYIEEDFRCILCGKKVEKDSYFCSGCYQKAILDNISIKKRGFYGSNRRFASRFVQLYQTGILCLVIVSALFFGIRSAVLHFRTVTEPELIVSEEAAKAAAVEQLTVQGKQFYLEENEEQRKWRLLKAYREEQVTVFRKMMEELYRQGNSIEEALEISSGKMRRKYPVLLYSLKLENLTEEEISVIYEKITAEENAPEKKEQGLYENKDERKQLDPKPVSESKESQEKPEKGQSFELG